MFFRLSFADSSPPLLADQSPVPSTSFLSQECNATVKYSASGKYKELIPSSVFRLYPSAKRMLKSGFFAVEVFPKVLENETPITKVNPKFEICSHSGGLAVNLHYYRLVFQSVCLLCQYLKQETLGRSVKQSIFSITLRYYEHCM